LRDFFKLKIESILMVTISFVQESKFLNATMIEKKMSDTLCVLCKDLSDAIIWEPGTVVLNGCLRAKKLAFPAK